VGNIWGEPVGLTHEEQEGEKKEQSKASVAQKQEAAKVPVDEAEAKRLRNMALFERALQGAQKKGTYHPNFAIFFNIKQDSVYSSSSSYCLFLF
jgi:hypothetical protein